MPYDEFELDDPLELVAAGIPLEAEHLAEMAECFAEEYARMGYDAEALFDLFCNPFYRGPYSVYQAQGAEYVRDLIAGVVGQRPAAPAARHLVHIRPLPARGKE